MKYCVDQTEVKVMAWFLGNLSCVLILYLLLIDSIMWKAV